MKILTLCYEFPPLGGGGAKVVYGLTSELARLGHEIDVITMGFKDLPKLEVVNGVNIYRAPSIRKKQEICHTEEMVFHIISALPLILRLHKIKSYTLNHTHFIFPDGVLALILKKLTGLPFIITSHGSDVPGYNPDRFKLQHKILSPIWLQVVKNAQQIICPSKSLESLLLAQTNDARISIIPNGIDLNKFCSNFPKKMRVLVVTRMFKRKRVQDLIKAVGGIDLKFDINIVGDGPYLETLRQMANNLNTDIKFWGWLDNDSQELKYLYETSSIFVFTSESENFPINLLEAMSAGLAIITSSNSGCREVVGDAALLVEPRVPYEISAALKKLETNPQLCQDLGRKARQRLQNIFSWPIIAKQYNDIYQKFNY